LEDRQICGQKITQNPHCGRLEEVLAVLTGLEGSFLCFPRTSSWATFGGVPSGLLIVRLNDSDGKSHGDFVGPNSGGAATIRLVVNIVKSSLREILGESHIAAIAIAVLLVWSFDAFFWTLWLPLPRAASFLVSAVAIFGVPFDSFTPGDRVTLIASCGYLFSACCSLLGAWLLSRWVYDAGPLTSLMRYRTKLARRDHA
jgi:hypothetical protein